MIDPSLAANDPPRRSRARRRETMINAVATLLGCLALVVMIATVVRVVMVKLWESARVNPAYVQSVYDSSLEQRWSGDREEHPAMLDKETKFQAPAPANKNLQAGKPPADRNLKLGQALPPPNAPSRTTSTTLGTVATVEKDPTAKAETAEASSETTSAVPSGIMDIEKKRPQIEATIHGFFDATSVVNKLAFSRDPQRVRSMMERYYSSHPLGIHEWKNLGWVLPVKEIGYRLGYAQVLFANSEPVSLIIEELDDGTFRVDWESSVRYGEIEWAEFIKTKPDTPKLFRVIASKPRTLPGETPQGSEVIEIKHPDEDDVLYAYFDRKDPKFQSLLQQLQTRNWKDVPLTLRLCYPGPAGGGKSVRIADVEGKGWLILNGTRS